MEQYVSKEQFDNLHEPSFMETYEVIFDFLIGSEKRYERLRDFPEKESEPLAKVCNSIMGAGKSTALQVIAKQALECDIPLLCVFNNRDNMESFKKSIDRLPIDAQRRVLAIDSDSYDQHTNDIIRHYQVVVITQQRLRDLRMGFGDYESFKFYTPSFLIDSLQRTILIDEMPIFVDSEVFDIGNENNTLDWFDEMAGKSKLPKIEIQKARPLIPYLISTEMAEVFRIEKEENHCIPTQKLSRYLSEEQIENLLQVLNDFKALNTDYQFKKRYNWFMDLFKHDSVGVISREEKKNVLLCAKWLDYRDFGNILILDGTADVTRTIYEHGGFDLIKVKNHHSYQKRLKIHHKIINTSKRGVNQEVHIAIGKDILEVRKGLMKEERDILPLPTKSDISTYVNNGAITNQQQQQFFKDRAFDNDSMALNLLNTTGKNDIAEFSSIGLLSLPIRHANYYKLFAIAMNGTDIDVSLTETKLRNKQSEFSNQWFVNDCLQVVFEELVIADISQIIHRTSLRYLQELNDVDVHIYTIRTVWIQKLVALYKLEEDNLRTVSLSKDLKFEENCRKRLIDAIETMRVKERYSISLGKISRPFKEWLNRNWNDLQKQEVIIKVANELGLTIDENPVTKYKTLILE